MEKKPKVYTNILCGISRFKQDLSLSPTGELYLSLNKNLKIYLSSIKFVHELSINYVR